jgi:hypothetical protein
MSEINTDKRITYSLFSPKKTYDHRFWDENKHDLKRYWFNIPAILAINKFLYPDFRTTFYVDPKTESDELFSLIKETSYCDYFVINEDYEGHEPSIWRINPFWEEGAKTFFSRDIDSIPNEEEFKASMFFLRSDQAIHTIRSHENHYGFPCRMLIGLSGFKINWLPKRIFKDSLSDFKKEYGSGNQWDNDQISLINCFAKDPFLSSMAFLDSRINNQNKRPEFYCEQSSEENFKDIDLSASEIELFNYIKKNKLCDWAGQPTDCRKEHLLNILRITRDKELLTILTEEKLSNFYF